MKGCRERETENPETRESTAPFTPQDGLPLVGNLRRLARGHFGGRIKDYQLIAQVVVPPLQGVQVRARIARVGSTKIPLPGSWTLVTSVRPD